MFTNILIIQKESQFYFFLIFSLHWLTKKGHQDWWDSVSWTVEWFYLHCWVFLYKGKLTYQLAQQSHKHCRNLGWRWLRNGQTYHGLSWKNAANTGKKEKEMERISERFFLCHSVYIEALKKREPNPNWVCTSHSRIVAAHGSRMRCPLQEWEPTAYKRVQINWCGERGRKSGVRMGDTGKYLCRQKVSRMGERGDGSREHQCMPWTSLPVPPFN